MTDLDLWAIAVGAISPLVIALVQQKQWPSHVKAIIMVVSVILIGLGNVYFNGQFDVKDMSHSILLVFVGAITAYHGLWKPTGVAPAIESATSKKAA